MHQYSAGEVVLYFLEIEVVGYDTPRGVVRLYGFYRNGIAVLVHQVHSNLKLCGSPPMPSLGFVGGDCSPTTGFCSPKRVLACDMDSMVYVVEILMRAAPSINNSIWEGFVCVEIPRQNHISRTHVLDWFFTVVCHQNRCFSSKTGAVHAFFTTAVA